MCFVLAVQYGFVGPNWAPRPVAALENDEICAELRQYTEQLRALMGRNKATVERLLKAAASATTRNEEETELSGPKAKEVEDRYIKRKRAQKQRKKGKKRRSKSSSAMGTAAINDVLAMGESGGSPPDGAAAAGGSPPESGQSPVAGGDGDDGDDEESTDALQRCAHALGLDRLPWAPT